MQVVGSCDFGSWVALDSFGVSSSDGFGQSKGFDFDGNLVVVGDTVVGDVVAVGGDGCSLGVDDWHGCSCAAL